MSAADRIRRALDTVDPDASGNAAGYTEGDVAGLLDERDRLEAQRADAVIAARVEVNARRAAEQRAASAEAQLADERRDRAEVYRQHTGLTAELDRAHRDLSGARSTVFRLGLELTGAREEVRKLRGGAEVVIAQRNGRDRHIADLEQRIALARRYLTEHPDGTEASNLRDGAVQILDGYWDGRA